MEQIFQMSDALCSRIGQFSQRLDALRTELKALDEHTAAEQAAELAASLRRRADDFFREDRNFSIAVLGQVKAGKSTFLNSLLFDGRPILPSARTPKTAALTRLEYAPESSLTVEYLSAEEWDTLRQLAVSPLDTPQVRAARETVGLVRDGGAALESLFAMGTEQIPLVDEAGLGTLLNEYVGENGRFSPAVKCLTLRLNLDSLRHLSVVDTPGFYDPVLSRVERTRRCLETCDAAFYLSRAGSFLDRYDMELLTELIPLRGISSLTLIASQMDSALADALPSYPGLTAALTGCQEILRNHAEESLEHVLQRAAGPVYAAVTQCRRPVFVSAITSQMAKKPPEAYDGQEQLIYRLLSLRGAPGPDALESIGNMEKARALFFRLAADKEDVLLHKLDALLLSSQSELALLLERLCAKATQRLSALEALRQSAEERQADITAQIGLVQDKAQAALADYLAPVEGALASVLLGLGRLRESWAVPALREDFVLKAQVRTVSDTKLLLPWTWGKSHSECAKEKIPRAYLDPEDVRRSLEQLASVAAALQETSFLRFSDFTDLADGLFAAGESLPECPEPASLRAAVEAVLSRLAPGRPSPPVSFYLPASTRNPEDDEALRTAARKAAAQITETQERTARQEAARLRKDARLAGADFCIRLCKKLQQEQEALAEQRQELDASAARLRELLDLPKRYA